MGRATVVLLTSTYTIGGHEPVTLRWTGKTKAVVKFYGKRDAHRALRALENAAYPGADLDGARILAGTTSSRKKEYSWTTEGTANLIAAT